MIYLIGSPEFHSRYKIGYTAGAVRQRLLKLQVASPFPLVVAWQAEGGPTVEKRLHLEFADRRVQGEWFDFTGTDAVALVRAAFEERGLINPTVEQVTDLILEGSATATPKGAAMLARMIMEDD